MAVIIQELVKGYRVFNEEWSDPRSKDMFLISSPFSVAALIIFYVYFVKVLGPALMADQKPFNLERIIMIFDLTQIIANIYIFYKCFALGWGGRYNWRCEPIDYSESPHAMEIIQTMYLYYVIKIVDMIDTVFFALRKKNNSITFLHVYHHAGMVFASWIGVKFFPGGHITFLGLVNTFVHAVMYMYYFITSLNPEYKKAIWWKKHITQLQMFLCIIVHSSQLFLWNPCKYPLTPMLLLVPQNFFMLVLFYDFYRKAYRKKKIE